MSSPSASPSGARRGASAQDILAHHLAVAKDFVKDPPVRPTTKRASHAFLVGYLINVALDGILPGILRKKSASEALRSLVSGPTFRSASSLALYSLLYRTLIKHITRLRILLLDKVPSPDSQDLSTHRSRLYARLTRTLRSAFLVPFLAALAASPASILFPNPSLRQTFSIWALVSGIESVYREARRHNSRLVSWVPDFVGGGFFYALGNGQLLWSFLFEPECFPSAYGKVILARSTAYIPPRPSGLPASIPWPAPREVADTIALLSTPSSTSPAYPAFSAPLLSALTPLDHATTSYSLINPILDYSPAHPAHTSLLCAVLHPTEPSCWKNFFSFWVREWGASARFVAAFAAIGQAFAWKKMLKDPETALFKYAKAVVQGATVISGSIGTAWALTCFFQKYLPRTFLPRSRYFLNGVLSSVFILAVPRARRAQLGSYVTRQSLASTWGILKKQGKVKSIRNGDVFLLALGLGMLASLHENRPTALPGSTRRGLSLILGPPNEAEKAVLAQRVDPSADFKSE
ncbi:uncharacterized protein PFL1_00352 [Pseudozyma flocculosa PF-1]|uniref:Transmembrane protein 135 N-terminal domain-containing protein n=1 Tax=Pseudozyma flocculosa TaxID=84751 RepID=A0A5C3ETQ2_9BASI|nr:uncharacterized protein PFL1_00352 [Pseudozyma flocculosa PF-1]EPQ32155.1 hypothetical protein PFL1_00352 [Pseudozyma flocculosa PF-1]SPO34906.1 uncharacterized protein PSFLO_00377 [Pseudozyma flocculosa]